MAQALKPSEAVRPTDAEIYATWQDIHAALRDVMRNAPPEVVRWLAEYSKHDRSVQEAAEAHLEATGE